MFVHPKSAEIQSESRMRPHINLVLSEFNRSVTVRRAADIIIATCLLVLLSPLLALAAIGVSLSSPGPTLYRARRIGRDRRQIGNSVEKVIHSHERRQENNGGREFTLYKLRTMDVGAEKVGPPITASNDKRVFPFGAWLRRTKIDELPQLINVIKGDMAIVGPRPEDPAIVRRYYRPEDLQTLQVLPGLTSPGTLYYYTDAERGLGNTDVIEEYVMNILPEKLAIDRQYLRQRSLTRDLRVVVNTMVLILRKAFAPHFFHLAAPRH
jgi:lipopolysaccharide/colanic/teichoic acid biosynthesis glycosyltransferase